MMGDHYLITGGCGFIGSHLAEALVGAGHRVRIFDNLSSGHLANIAPIRDAVEFIEGDVRDAGAIRDACADVRFVFHEAALVSVFESVEQPQLNHEINLTGTLNVLEAARAQGVQRLVMASSAAVYGNDPTLPKEEGMRPDPVSPYAIAKIAGEYMLRVYAGLYGLETVSLRYFNVYGPRQDPNSMYSGVISKFAQAFAAGETPTIFGDGQQTRDFVFVGDVVQANLLAMGSPDVGRGEALNVGTGQRTSLLDLVAALGQITGVACAPRFKPLRAGDVRDSVAAIERARQVLGYQPSHSLGDGLQTLINAMRG